MKKVLTKTIETSLTKFGYHPPNGMVISQENKPRLLILNEMNGITGLLSNFMVDNAIPLGTPIKIIIECKM